MTTHTAATNQATPSAVTTSGQGKRLRDREVGAHEGDDQRHRLFAGRREDEEHCGAHPAVLVQVQERPQEEGRRQGHGVELVEDEEAERRIEQVRAGEERAGGWVTVTRVPSR